MSATLVSSNTTLKVSALIAFTATTTGVKYTVPANTYSIVNLCIINGGASTVISVGGNQYYSSSVAATSYFTLHLGPTQTINITTIASTTVNASGVELINSP